MKWKLSDETVIHLGGRVDGDSELASSFRADVKEVRAGHRPRVPVDPSPAPSEPLDLNDLRVVDGWVRSEAWAANVEVVEAPAIEREQATDSEPDDDGHFPIF